MPAPLAIEKQWSADEFVVTDQHLFGDAWRYELVDGVIVAHAAPSPEHAAILAGLISLLGRLLANRPDGCRPETGSAATPRTEQRNTARIPDAMIRCGQHPRVAFDVVSPSEIRDWRARDLRRQHLQSVFGLEQIVELFQDDYAAHVYSRVSALDAVWAFEAVGGPDAALRLPSVSLELALAEIYAFSDLPRAEVEN